MVFNSLGAGYIQFCTEADPTCSSASATGDFEASGPGTGSFSGLTSGEGGTIDNITDTPPAASPFTYVPVGVPVSMDNYLVLTGFPAWDFQANLLVAASCALTSTQMCFGPFELNQNGPNVSVTIDVFGTLINTADGSTSTFDLALTGQYLNTTIAAVEAAGESPAGVFSDSWSATADATPTSEPGTASTMLLAAGSLVMASRLRRRRKS
jgi:MYXO-CTERM domain-containing protein